MFLTWIKHDNAGTNRFHPSGAAGAFYSGERKFVHTYINKL